MSEFAENLELPVAYLKSIALENVRSFKGENEVFLSDSNEKSAQWTVILGNNNTGKTTILKCIADLYLKTAKMSNVNWSQGLMPTNEDFYTINPIINNSTDLISHQKGSYSVELLTLGTFPPTVIQEDTGSNFTNSKICGLVKEGGKFTATIGHPHLRKIFLQGYSTLRKTAESSLSEQENTETVQSL